MHLIVTGHAEKDSRFADVRIVAADDDQNIGINVVSTLKEIYSQKAQNALAKYGMSQKFLKVEPKSDKGDAALRFQVPRQLVEEFIDDRFFSAILNKFGEIKQIPVAFSSDDVIGQINAPSMDDLKIANDMTDNFIENLFQKLNSTEVQGFLRNYCGKIKLVQPTGNGKGWELVQFSERNSVMILCQMLKNGIQPQFVCSARDWARYFNRRVRQDQLDKGAVIEVPKHNKRLDKDKFKQAVGVDYDTASSQGAAGYAKNWIGYNQNDDNHDFYPGVVYDETQTELMTDANGQPLPDILNDPNHQRRVTNVGNNVDLKYQQPNQAQQAVQNRNDIQNGVASPFEENLDKIPKCIENIAQSIKFDRFQKKNGGKFDSVIPLLDAARQAPTADNMGRVVEELAKCEMYQVENTRFANLKDNYVKVIKNVVMSNCGFGDTYQLADFARQIVNERQTALKLWDAIRNITNLINGALLMKENNVLNEELCKNISFTEFLGMLGTSEEELASKEQKLQESKESVKNKFFNQLNKMNNVKF